MTKKYVICMFCLFLLLLAISRAESICTRRCGDVDILFPFGIEQGCFLPGFHVVCNSSKLYSGDIQISQINPNKSRAIILQKINPDCSRSIDNSSNEVLASTEMNLTGSPFSFSSDRNIFAAFGCNVVAFYNTSSTASDNRPRFSCASLCADDVNYVDLNDTCSGADGCCLIDSLPDEMQQFASYFILDHFAGFNGLPSQNSCRYSFIVDRESFNASSADDLRGRYLYEPYQEQLVPVAVDWAITGDASCEEAQLNSTTYACRSLNSFCHRWSYGYRYTCSCNYYYEGNPYMEGGCSVGTCRDVPGCYGACPENKICTCPPGKSGDPHRPNGCNAKDTRIRNILMIISASAGGSVLICFAVVALWRILKKRNLQNRKKKFYRRNLDLLKKE